MKERPILFSGEMVKAILEGRKTQTRRVIKKHPLIEAGFSDNYIKNPDNFVIDDCPYGAIGDQLWVRETFCLESNFNMDDIESYPPPFKDGRPIKHYEDDVWGSYWEQPHYRATDPTPELVIEGEGGDEPGVRWKPSIHMPRWASRIMLEITGVRVERLQEIGCDDALAEGIDYSKCDPSNAHQYWREEAVAKFQELWDSINAKRGYGWGTNPYVWVIEFKRVAP